MLRVFPDYKQESRKRILWGAQDAFAEKGYDQTTMADIAKKIGVSKGTLYLYFTSKEELYAQLTQMIQTIAQATLDTAAKSDSLLQFADVLYQTFMEQPEVNLITTFEVISEASRNEGLRKILVADYGRRHGIFAEFLREQQSLGKIREDVDVRQLSFAMISLILGIMIGKTLGADQEFIKQTWEGTIRMLYESVRATPA
jgi:AcrR family transcriptional regulator